MRRAAKRDANEAGIVAGLEAMGCSVSRIDSDEGFPDLVVGFRGHAILLEVKPPTGRLTARQRAWHAAWRGRAYVVHDPAEAIQIVRNKTQ